MTITLVGTYWVCFGVSLVVRLMVALWVRLRVSPFRKYGNNLCAHLMERRTQSPPWAT